MKLINYLLNLFRVCGNYFFFLSSNETYISVEKNLEMFFYYKIYVLYIVEMKRITFFKFHSRNIIPFIKKKGASFLGSTSINLSLIVQTSSIVPFSLSLFFIHGFCFSHISVVKKLLLSLISFLLICYIFYSNRILLLFVFNSSQ